MNVAVDVDVRKRRVIRKRKVGYEKPQERGQITEQ